MYSNWVQEIFSCPYVTTKIFQQRKLPDLWYLMLVHAELDQTITCVRARTPNAARTNAHNGSYTWVPVDVARERKEKMYTIASI